MTNERNNHKVLIVISGIVIVVLIAGFVGRNQIKGYVKEKAAVAIVEKLLDEKIANDKKISGRLNAKEIYDSMDEKDKQRVMDIITGNMTDENVKQVSSYITSGDMSGLKQYVKGSLSSEDKADSSETL